MTTTDYLSRELRRARLSLHRAEKKPNTPESEMQGLRDKIACLEEALAAVQGREMEEKPLTWDQLQKMDGKPVWSKKHREWFLICIRGAGRLMMYDRNGFCLPVQDVIDYGLYSHTPPHLNRDAWEPCDHCKPAEYPPDYYGPHDFPIVGNEIYYYDTDDGWEGEEINFCPWCCRPLTDAAWAELERRVQG